MKREPFNFGAAIAATQRQARASLPVVTLNHDLSPEQRRIATKQTLQRAVTQLEIAPDSAIDRETVEIMKDIESRLASRRLSAEVHLRMEELVGVMGRRAP